ncbi:hypothetical protein RhiLY_03576 [Ceratobasidium sp. AG-Ba]|nr:hypothetical protein RhiLY_03576 [Ceratobasidium sp. AG-Ba]
MTSSDTSSFGVSTGENTTPLPSSPKPLPPVGDQHASPNNQAFAEAIASLAYASDLLSNASKAMSSAVESFMLAGSHSLCFDFLTHNHGMSSPKNYAQDWLNRNYSLNPIKEPAETPQTSSLLFEAGFEAGSQGKALPEENNANDHPRGANRENDVDQSVENDSDASRLELIHPGGGSDSPVKEAAVNEEGSVSGTPVVRPQSPSQVVEFASEQTSDSVESVTSSPKSSGGHITELESTLDGTPNQDGQSAQQAFEQSTTQAGALTLYCLGGYVQFITDFQPSNNN